MSHGQLWPQDDRDTHPCELHVQVVAEPYHRAPDRRGPSASPEFQNAVVAYQRQLNR